MSFHLYEIEELYSNADGTIQYVEFHVGPFDGESFWRGVTLTSSAGAQSHVYTFPANLPSVATANTSVLAATQAFADLGIVTPDYIIPSGFLFTGGGTRNYGDVDVVTYGPRPSDGAHALSHDGGVVSDTPRNFAGATGVVPPAPPRVTGGSGDDTLQGGPGDDLLSGGAGHDTARFAGTRSAFAVQRDSHGVFSVTDDGGAGGGTDTLSSVEALQFTDKSFSLVNPARAHAPDYGKDNGFLFDAVFYLLDNPQKVPAVTVDTALADYLASGAAQHLAPNSWFDAAWYSAKWPDLAALHLDDATLFMHYNLFGVWEGRAAGPKFDHFDGNRYLAENPDVAAYVDANLHAFLGSRGNGAIAHYLIYGADEQRVAHDTSGATIDLGYVV